jgi:hypothetical protein
MPNYPTFDEMKAFVEESEVATVRSLSNRFDLMDADCSIIATKPCGERVIYAYGIDFGFYHYICEFIKQDCIGVVFDRDGCCTIDGVEPISDIKYDPYLIFSISAMRDHLANSRTPEDMNAQVILTYMTENRHRYGEEEPEEEEELENDQ